MAGYEKNEINLIISNEGTRNEVRMRVVEQLAKEPPGTGAEKLASRFIYYVEKLKDGNRVFLRRPAQLHYGFDFIVCVENANYSPSGKKARNYPSHNDFAKDLAAKKAENPIMYKELYRLLKKVFECHDIEEAEYENITFQTGFAVDHVLKTIKWLFIEQDIRYWNYSGRNMTWEIIPPAE